jgi:hypothetical protein
MKWKAWMTVLGVCMFVLAIVGLAVHSDRRLVVADVLGGFAAMAVALLANRGRTAQVLMPVLSAAVLLVIAVLAVASQRSPITTAMTLAFAFAFTFSAWSGLSSERRGNGGGRPVRSA